MLYVYMSDHKILLQGVPIESHPSKLVGSSDSKNRYFDFDKLAEVCCLLESVYSKNRYSCLCQ